ncbi:hypothetical protein Tco_0430912 [Tanacetum coccineum]
MNNQPPLQGMERCINTYKWTWAWAFMDGTISEFPGYTSSKEKEDEEEDEEEEEEEDKEEEKEESEKKRLKEASEMRSNSESLGYATICNE